MQKNTRMLTDIYPSADTLLTPKNVLHLAFSPGLKRNFIYLEGFGFRAYWASLRFGARKTTFFISISFSSSFSSKRDRLGCSSQKTFWSKSKATPPTLFSIFLNLETLTSIKNVKNSFSVKSGGLKNYKLLIRKPLLTCQFSQETCLIVFYYQKEKLLIWMVVRKLCLMYMLVRKLLLLMTS